MHKRWVIPFSLFFLFIISAAVYFTTGLKIESAWAHKKEEMVVLSNKVWNIAFNENLNYQFVNDTYVYVTNEKGDKINVSLSYHQKSKTITIKPPQTGYVDKMKYILHIDRKIQSVHGKELRKNKRIHFTVKENLPVVASREELNDFFLNIIENSKNINSGEIAVMEMAKDSSAETSNNGARDFSETNNQVLGIDEADIIKTDGTYIYQVEEQVVRIIKAYPADQMEIIANLTFEKSYYPNQLFLNEQLLVVVGHRSKEMYHSNKSMDSLMLPFSQTTSVLIYDLKDIRNPKLVREIEVEGSYVQARKKDGIIYLVSSYFPDFWMLEKDKDVDLRPKFKDSISMDKYEEVDYNQIHYLPGSSEANFTTITSIDLQTLNTQAQFTTFLGSGHHLYMSENNLYLAVPNYAMMNHHSEKTITAHPTTNIYKLAVDGMEVTFHSTTEVAGTILNQFSMDEHKGNFRLAVTEGSTWDDANPSANHLFIFDNELNEIGSLVDLARGERIYSVRFMGDRIFIVTFKETDPLFVIDAKNPKQPSVLGELKIPGFSNYLHPYDENHLIGFGHDTKIMTNNGGGNPIIVTNGVKISLFDVSDLSNPKEKFSEVIGGRGTYSPLNYDHKALLFNQKQELFAFPITIYEHVGGTENEQKFSFQGGYVYHINPVSGIVLKQKISHMEVGAPYEEWGSNISRLILIGEQIYAISPSKLTSHRIKDFELIGEIPLR
jgi:inhibitor of cysteine peptidase